MDPVVLGLYGKSDSGKTALIVQLISRLTKNGYNVASVKLSDKKIDFDIEGKDTWRHSQAGATTIVFSSPGENVYIIKNKQSYSKILNQITQIGQYDIVLVEGASDPVIQKIRIGDIEKRENTILNYKENIEEILELIENKLKENKPSKKGKNVTLKVNGKNIPLTEFPSTFIQDTVVGMLGSLKGVDEIKEVQLSLKR